MFGYLLAIGAALIFAVKETANKKLTEKTNVYIILWGTMLISLPFFALGIYFEGMPRIDPVFWLALGANTPLLIAANLLLIRGLQLSPFSLTLPFLSFTPLFMILTSFIMLGEFPNMWGVIGIILIPLGVFLLNSKHLRKGLWAPFHAIRSEKGSMLLIVVSLIWSITGNSDKIAIQNSSTFFYLFMITLMIAIIMTVIVWYKYHGHLKNEIKKTAYLLTIVGVTNTIALALQMIAIQKIIVPYVIAIKRAGLILGGIIIGAVYFKEKDFRYRIIGGLVMTVGVLMILLFH